MVQRIRVEDLTPGERQGLKDQGRDVPATGFMDLAVQQPVMVDARAQDRAKAAQALKSVVVPAAPAAQALPAPEPAAAPEPPKAQSADRVKDVPETPSTCVRCGWDHKGPAPAEPTKQEMQEFLRSVMAGTPYTSHLVLFGGAAEVTLRTRNELEDEGIRDALRFLIRAGKIEHDRDLVGRARRIHLAMAIKTLVLGKEVLEFSDFVATLGSELRDGQRFIDEVDARIGRIPTQLLTAIYRNFDRFTEVVDTMSARAQDPVFWIGSEPTP